MQKYWDQIGDVLVKGTMSEYVRLNRTNLPEGDSFLASASHLGDGRLERDGIYSG